jgi:hypothetical protein
MVWRRPEDLEEIKSSGGNTARSSGEGTKALEAAGGSGGSRRLWRRSNTPEAASTKLWKRQQALEVAGSCGGGFEAGEIGSVEEF